MIYTDLTRKAMRIAYEAHLGQTDREGVPYFFHPLYVAEQADTERRTVIALLHDVIEDTPETPESLVEKGIPEDIVRSICILSRPEEMTYPEYIEKVITSGDTDAIRVKYADLCHNSDPVRSKRAALPEKLVLRYRDARERVEAALNI